MDDGWIVTTSTESRLEKKLLPESNSNANTLLPCRKNSYLTCVSQSSGV